MIRLFPISKWREERSSSNENFSSVHIIRDVLFFNPSFQWMGFKKYHERGRNLQKPKWRFPFWFKLFSKREEERQSDGSIVPYIYSGFIAYEHVGEARINPNALTHLTFNNDDENRRNFIPISGTHVGGFDYGTGIDYVGVNNINNITGECAPICEIPSIELEEIYPKTERLKRIEND